MDWYLSKRDDDDEFTLRREDGSVAGWLEDFSPEDAQLVLRAVNSHARLVEALEMARNELVDESYGPFPGGDPRHFKPDPEACTPEEIEAHRLACIEWDKGEGEDRGPSCATFGDASAWTRTGYGFGTYTWMQDVVPTIDAALAAARGEGEA